ncbi:MAG: TIGR01777 family protein [Terriglobia bacterium]|nr:MAG: TIGR01777 family protein [Terriglobia bacterium]
MNITISGGSGFIGRRLLKVLGDTGHNLHVLSRHAGSNMPNGVKLSVWDLHGPPPRVSIENADVVIHLAGEPVGQRWTAAARRRILESRVEGTRRMVEALAECRGRRPVLLSASAVGYYGSRGEELLDEASPPGEGFLPEVCLAWEREAQAAAALGIRVAVVRIGVVLDPRGGALSRMLPPYRLGVGGPLGSGEQWMPWVHLSDLAELFRFLAENPIAGVFNGVAPFPVINREFTRELARALHRPAWFPVPRLALKALFGQMSEVLLASQRIIPRAADAAGFRFQFPQLGPALADLLK